MRAQVRELHGGTAATGTGGPAAPASGGASQGGTRHGPAPADLGSARPAAPGGPRPAPHVLPSGAPLGLVGRPARGSAPALGEGSRQGGVHEDRRENHHLLPGQQEVSLPPWDSLNFSLRPSSPAPRDTNHGSSRVTELLALFQSPRSLQVSCYDAQQSTDGVLEGQWCGRQEMPWQQETGVLNTARSEFH